MSFRGLKPKLDSTLYISLPLSSLKPVNLDPSGESAWSILCNAEEAAQSDTSIVQKYNNNLVGVRVLGSFIKDFWEKPIPECESIPYAYMVKDVLACNKEEDVNQAVYNLGLGYRNHLLGVFRSNTGSVPSPTRHSSCPSFEQHKLKMIETMRSAPQARSDVKSQALFRDGFKCKITGHYDAASIEKFREDVQCPPDPNTVDTQCAQLFSESAQQGYAATAFTMLKMFGLEDVVRTILGGQVDSLCNVMTMEIGLHQLYDRFGFWLEPLPGEPHTYNVCTHQETFWTRLTTPPRQVTFVVDRAAVDLCKNEKVPLPDLPDRRLIAIRSACARVAHMSGAAEQMDKILQDREDITVMSSDGGTGSFLNSLFESRLVYVGV